MSVDPTPGDAGRFGEHDYKISYRRSEDGAEVRISSRLARPLTLGESYTLERVGELLDFIVTEVRLAPDGTWDARCQVAGA